MLGGFDTHALKAHGRDKPWQHAYVGGTFDCLHRGHLALFAAVRKRACYLTVGLNTDAFAARYKRPPLMPLEDRLAVLNECRLVTRVVVNEGDEDSKPAIGLASVCAPMPVDVIVHGSDWVGDSLMSQMGLTQAWLDDNGVDLVILPYTAFTSTTQLLENHESRLRASGR